LLASKQATAISGKGRSKKTFSKGLNKQPSSPPSAEEHEQTQRAENSFGDRADLFDVREGLIAIQDDGIRRVNSRLGLNDTKT
jgi:hypothetical protein